MIIEYSEEFDGNVIVIGNLNPFRWLAAAWRRWRAPKPAQSFRRIRDVSEDLEALTSEHAPLSYIMSKMDGSVTGNLDFSGPGDSWQ